MQGETGLLSCDLSEQVSNHFNKFLARLCVSKGRAIAVTTASASALASLSTSASTSALLKMFKFVAKDFKSLYLFNLWMELVDTLSDVRYWSEVLCCTIMTHIGDLEVKVTDFEKFCVKVFGGIFFSTFLL